MSEKSPALIAAEARIAYLEKIIKRIQDRYAMSEDIQRICKDALYKYGSDK